MGETVAKSSKLSEKLGDIEWFTGIYFIYKRFLYERKQIERWLEKGEPKLTRYLGASDRQEWAEWFASEEKKTLGQKIKSENENIAASIVKMNKKLMKKNLPGNFLHHASLNRHSQEESKIAISEVVKEYDELDERGMLGDP